MGNCGVNLSDLDDFTTFEVWQIQFFSSSKTVVTSAIKRSCKSSTLKCLIQEDDLIFGE